MKRSKVNEWLDRGDDAIVGIADAHAAADRTDVWLAEASRQLPDGFRIENAIGVNGYDDLSAGVAQAIAHRARLPAVHTIPVDDDTYAGRVLLRLKHPLVAIVYRAIILRDDFKPFTGIVAAAETLDRVIYRPALAIAGQNHAHSWF